MRDEVPPRTAGIAIGILVLVIAAVAYFVLFPPQRIDRSRPRVIPSPKGPPPPPAKGGFGSSPKGIPPPPAGR